jgi:hypothetical protein
MHLCLLQVLGYDEEGRVLNYVGVSAPTPADITAAASRVLTFIDMGGHEKYLKTTLYGMTCTLPGEKWGAARWQTRLEHATRHVGAIFVVCTA